MLEPKGIIVTSGCMDAGKTVVCAGIAGSMLEIGLEVEAVKPLSFSEEDTDIKYLVQVTKRQPYYPHVVVEGWTETNKTSWVNLVKTCQNMAYPVLFESPGCVSTPLRSDDRMMDCTDLSKELNWPILLVADASVFPYETVTQALSFLKLKEVRIIGFMFTCSDNSANYNFIQELASILTIDYGCPYLGTIPFSPSISTKELKQGNNIKLTEKYIDLHPLQTELDPLLIK